MRLSLRFVVPLLLALTAVAYGVLPLAERLTERWFIRDLEIRASLVANTVQDQIAEIDRNGPPSRLLQFFDRIANDERTYAVAFCRTPTADPIGTPSLPVAIRCQTLDRFAGPAGHVIQSATGRLLVSVRPLPTEQSPEGELILVHDMGFVERRSEETRRYFFYFFVGLALTVSLLTVVIAQLSWRGWVHGMRALLRGEGLLRPMARPHGSEFHPIAADLRELIRDIEGERHPRDADRQQWSAEGLRMILHEELRGQEVIVVSNREPCIHERIGDHIEVRRPASGLVTALEPIMRACSGTWIAHGSGSADREVVDAHDRVGVPPENPAYRLRRVWLSQEEENGYYYGFANEGLWPLCHHAHVRPVFRTPDWDQYTAVNRRFAEAVAREAKSPDPIVLVQDYHFALLPRMVRELLPAATVITFWHIPWPNPEAFSICPWREQLIDGLLGSSILGFHTQFHCNNFLDTVDRLLEARVDRESFTVSYRGELTAVNRYPISIEWPPAVAGGTASVADCRQTIRRRHGLSDDHYIGVGVDRLDYTKGIEERFRAVERLLELHPEWIGRFSFVQIAAPSRSGIPEYHHYQERVVAGVERINKRFDHAGAPAIILLVAHHEPHQVYEYYRAADLCFVSSLHDGMNLVAKEFLAARDDDRGVLILSQFTGAARELPEAMIVNPYDADQCAAALEAALLMPEDEQRARMRLMRGLIAEFNVYRWAGRMLIDAASMRNRNRLLMRAGRPS
jgi:trehalose 6-phosphate synthase